MVLNLKLHVQGATYMRTGTGKQAGRDNRQDQTTTVVSS